MAVLEVIRSRRSVFQFRPDVVPQEVVETVLGYGLWAPCHHLTEPWRFTAIGGKTKVALARLYGDLQKERAAAQVSVEDREGMAEKGFQKLMSKPMIVVVSYVQDDEDEHRRLEDYAATCCAMQNVQLAAWNEGVGMQWSSGAITRDERTYALLDIDQKTEYIVGFFYMGYPAEVRTSQRRPLSEVLRWTA